MGQHRHAELTGDMAHTRGTRNTVGGEGHGNGDTPGGWGHLGGDKEHGDRDIPWRQGT